MVIVHNPEQLIPQFIHYIHGIVNAAVSRILEEILQGETAGLPDAILRRGQIPQQIRQDFVVILIQLQTQISRFL